MASLKCHGLSESDLCTGNIRLRPTKGLGEKLTFNKSVSEFRQNAKEKAYNTRSTSDLKRVCTTDKRGTELRKYLKNQYKNG